MAAKMYEARLKHPGGREEEVEFMHANFDGNEAYAKREYERLHPGIEVLSLKEKGNVTAQDQQNIAGAIEKRQPITKPTPVAPGAATNAAAVNRGPANV